MNKPSDNPYEDEQNARRAQKFFAGVRFAQDFQQETTNDVEQLLRNKNADQEIDQRIEAAEREAPSENRDLHLQAMGHTLLEHNHMKKAERCFDALHGTNKKVYGYEQLAKAFEGKNELLNALRVYKKLLAIQQKAASQLTPADPDELLTIMSETTNGLNKKIADLQEKVIDVN